MDAAPANHIHEFEAALGVNIRRLSKIGESGRDRRLASQDGIRELIPMNRLFWQAVLAFLVLPGTVAFVVPLLLFAPVRRPVFR